MASRTEVLAGRSILADAFGVGDDAELNARHAVLSERFVAIGPDGDVHRNVSDLLPQCAEGLVMAVELGGARFVAAFHDGEETQVLVGHADGNAWYANDTARSPWHWHRIGNLEPHLAAVWDHLGSLSCREFLSMARAR